MMTETDTDITPAEARVLQELAREAEKFAEQERRFVALENNITTLRAFIAEHHDAFAPFQWSCYGWDLTINFGCGDWYDKANDAKAIAKGFGSAGWKREPDRSTCGKINWVKFFDGGIMITISGAEFLKPNLIPEVKL